jgi:hypothetical protein
MVSSVTAYILLNNTTSQQYENKPLGKSPNMNVTRINSA